MTKLLCLLLLMLPASFVLAVADPVDQAAALIKSGNATELGKLFAPTIDLTVPGSAEMYSANQATLVIDKFFKSNTVRAVKVIHRINSNPTIKYAVISVATATGNFRFSVSMKGTGGDYKITELRIEPDRG